MGSLIVVALAAIGLGADLKGLGFPIPSINITTPTITYSGNSVEVTLVVTSEFGELCGEPIRDISKSIIDIAVNNNSEKDIILTSVKLVPHYLEGEILPVAPALEISETYYVSISPWLNKIHDKGYVKIQNPNPILVRGISRDKFTIEAHDQERFQIILGADGLYYLRGMVHIEVETDSKLVLKSDRLEIIVCSPSILKEE